MEFDELRDGPWHRIDRGVNGRGLLSFEGALYFSGDWEGEFSSSDENSLLWISECARFKGEISAHSVIVEGNLEQVRIRATHLLLKSSAKVGGQISAKYLTVDEGAVVESEIDTSSHRQA